MSAGLNPRIDTRQFRSRRYASSRLENQVTPLRRNPTSPTPIARFNQTPISRLPDPEPLPLWLRSLMTLQRGVSLTTFTLAVGVLAAYGQMVHSQQQWSHDYHHLQKLQRHERELMSSISALKNQIAKQAELPDAGLVAPTPTNAIFLAPAPSRRSTAPKAVIPPAVSAPHQPLGY